LDIDGMSLLQPL